ncbi:hypothetical protein Aduo_016908 [Ancylostoma duodenale]
MSVCRVILRLKSFLEADQLIGAAMAVNTSVGGSSAFVNSLDVVVTTVSFVRVLSFSFPIRAMEMFDVGFNKIYLSFVSSFFVC